MSDELKRERDQALSVAKHLILSDIQKREELEASETRYIELRDAIIANLNPQEDDMAEEAILIEAVQRAARALAYYTTATFVSSWGMQELGDNGEVARAALGLRNHSSDCRWPETILLNPDTMEVSECICGLLAELQELQARSNNEM